MRIEICGGIASGKTSLARMLEREGFYPVYEQLGGITFLDEFYSNPSLFGFETEISFLLQHSVEIKKAMSFSGSLICDYSFEQDYAYAINNLSGNELQVFKTVFDEVKQQIKEPQLIIQLECSNKVKLRRIQNRGRTNEQTITEEYLESTDKLISKRLSSISIPVLCINTEMYDFRETEVIQRDILPLIQRHVV